MSNVNPIYHHTHQMLIQEKEWIDNAKDDITNFAPLYEKYYDQIFRYINQRMHDEHLASDVTSQVFLKAIKNLNRFEFRGIPIASWLYRIAKSELNQAYRDARAKRAINIDDVQIATFIDVFKDESFDLNKKRMFHALSQLNGRDIQLIELRYFQGYAYREIADIIGVKENNAKVKTFRALEKLKKHFANNQ
ncbi:sigma-70 family RNA polymerase sigma factor [Brumimicrobium salinarum]|uniref:Sigma-70 family RNA polymerase sigma factor n=1 Tax=Brumimicrobium salinarum TaxID=2058658 RepID=A0A2I0R120_9FLAO|nr:sigma-70 family RNA polymerase sigma factor [Brumimicrobium salinarum]PKR80268.1 sigma-70 family RNA polymerase sigma factor [Brumimicrobium salinarum]